MPKVKNLTGKGLSLLRHRILPDGRVQDAKGNILLELPFAVAHTAQALRFVKQGLIAFEGAVSRKNTIAVKPGVAAKVVLTDEVKGVSGSTVKSIKDDKKSKKFK